MEFQRRRAEGATSTGPSTVTGEMMIDKIIAGGTLALNCVVFRPGARTYWHSHTEGQLFIVEQGRGVVVNAAGEHHHIEAGDSVYTPAGEVHWHGAAPDSYVSYKAVSLGATQWQHEVSERDYASVWEPTAEA